LVYLTTEEIQHFLITLSGFTQTLASTTPLTPNQISAIDNMSLALLRSNLTSTLGQQYLVSIQKKISADYGGSIGGAIVTRSNT
jgi:hypothetical protein